MFSCFITGHSLVIAIEQTKFLVTALVSFRVVARFFKVRCNTVMRQTKQGRRCKSLGEKLGCLRLHYKHFAIE